MLKFGAVMFSGMHCPKACSIVYATNTACITHSWFVVMIRSILKYMKDADVSYSQPTEDGNRSSVAAVVTEHSLLSLL